ESIRIGVLEILKILKRKINQHADNSIYSIHTRAVVCIPRLPQVWQGLQSWGQSLGF
ncbi:hypothetical protein ACJX0J_008409, partial [Zea mays]